MSTKAFAPVGFVLMEIALGCGPHPSASTANSGARPAPLTRVTLEQIQGSYDQNPVAAQAWLQGKRVSFTDRISGITTDRDGSWGIGFLHAPQDPSKADDTDTVYFHFGAADKPNALGLVKGDQVTCVGMYASDRTMNEQGSGRIIVFEGESVKLLH